ncbi:MAG: hypothetical protein WBH01_02195 [Dehalococcoidia bacterium]
MGTIDIRLEETTVEQEGKKYALRVYSEAALEGFNPKVLGLGNIGQRSRRTDVIAAVFDLAGFTGFCSQVDPHLILPRFLKEFLDWLFGDIKSEFEERRFGEKVLLYSDLPFFAKFTGDGVVFLWDTANMDMRKVCNVLVIAEHIWDNYSKAFAPKAKRYLSQVPKALKCGLACGLVCSVGKGEDYVGACINIASRLQKLSNMRFCCSQRGINIEEGMLKKTQEAYVTKRVSIRGIGSDERVIVGKSDFEKLSKRDKAIFKDV